MKMKFKTNKPLATQLSILALLSSCVTAVNSAEIKNKVENKTKNIAALSKAKNEAALNRKKTRMTKDEQIEHAKQDLAKQLEIGVKDIMLLSSQAVTWSSGALGCPKSGEQYTQALQAGTLIVLGASGKHYRYHSGKKGVPKYCPNHRAQMPSNSESEI